jgi:hypothetical protein
LKKEEKRGAFGERKGSVRYRKKNGKPLKMSGAAKLKKNMSWWSHQGYSVSLRNHGPEKLYQVLIIKQKYLEILGEVKTAMSRTPDLVPC